MDKKHFVEIIKELVQLRKDADNLHEAFKVFNPDFNFISLGRCEDLIVKNLEYSMDDTSQWISYWLYETDCGKKNMGVTIDGKKVPMKTAENLFDCIKNVK